MLQGHTGVWFGGEKEGGVVRVVGNRKNEMGGGCGDDRGGAGQGKGGRYMKRNLFQDEEDGGGVPTRGIVRGGKRNFGATEGNSVFLSKNGS